MQTNADTFTLTSGSQNQVTATCVQYDAIQYNNSAVNRAFVKLIILIFYQISLHNSLKRKTMNIVQAGTKLTP